MVETDITQKTKDLIDKLKSICGQYGLGNDGNEFKIIVEVFLYKFLNDKFVYELKQIKPKLNNKNFFQLFDKLSDNDIEEIMYELSPDTAKLKKEHLVSFLFNNQTKEDFAKLFDDTLMDISLHNNEIFSVKTGTGAKVELFNKNLSQYISDPSERDNFCRAIINPLVKFSFEEVFIKKYDFFSTIFEYLIKDYNTDSGGKYAEYYTPHSVASIMAEILVDGKPKNVKCYDPSAGSGTLLMCIAHEIGEDKCSIYSQDVSQKSSTMLRLNLILNNLVHSIPNIIKGNTLLKPHHKDGDDLMKFDYIVSNPPFKLDFSDYRDDLDHKANTERFFAGVPKAPAKNKNGMAIYLLFIQHIMHSLSKKGKAAIVVPTGFITAQSGIEKKIRRQIIDRKMLKGVISMPSNIFATTGTNVSIILLDKTNTEGKITLMDASKLGETIKEGKNQRTVLSDDDRNQIINTFKSQEPIEDLSVVLSYDDIKEKNYSFSAGQYFDIKIEYINISHDEFTEKMNSYKSNLKSLFEESKTLEEDILKQIEEVNYES